MNEKIDPKHFAETEWFELPPELSHLIDDPPDKLFHYTNAAGAEGIISSSSLWATEIRYLNDYSELKTATNVIRSILQHTRSDSDLPNQRAATFVEMLDRHIIGFDFVKSICVASLSAEPNMLSQWRAYAPRNGYALGFDAGGLISKARSQDFLLIRCTYDQDEKAMLLHHLVNQAISFIANYTPWPDDIPIATSCLNNFAHNAARIVGTFAPAIKHVSFSDEKEWRLIKLPKTHVQELCFRIRDDTIVPYSVLSLSDEDGTIPMNHIYIGPSSNQNLTSFAIQQCVRGKSRQMTYTKSAIPYRSTIT